MEMEVSNHLKDVSYFQKHIWTVVLALMFTYDDTSQL